MKSKAFLLNKKLINKLYEWRTIVKKCLIIIVSITLIAGLSLYLKSESSYNLVKKEMAMEEKNLNIEGESKQNQRKIPQNNGKVNQEQEKVTQNKELINQDQEDLAQNKREEVSKSQEEFSQSEEETKQKENESTQKSFQRSAEDIAIDKRIKDKRLMNEENYKKNGIMGSLDIGKGLAPKKSFEEILEESKMIHSTLKDYMNSNTEIYPEYDESIDAMNTMPTIDPRFEELIWGTPKEERKGLLKGHNDEDMSMMQIKRLDGEYDEVFLVRDPSTGEWSVDYVGNYYDFKEKVEKVERN